MKKIFISLISVLLFFNSSVNAQHDNVSDLQMKAENYEQQGNYNLAISTYRRVLSITGSKAPIYAKLGNLFKAINNHNKAKEFYYKAISIDTNHTASHLELANIYVLEKNYKLVSGHYLKYIQNKNANQTDSLACLNYLFLAKKYYLVINLFNKLSLEANVRENPDINRLMGYTYSKKKSPQYQLAYQHFNIYFNSSQLSEKDSGDFLKMYTVCAHINTAEAHQSGISYLEKLSKLDTTKKYYDELAKSYLNWNHDYDKAAYYFEKAIVYLKKNKKTVGNSVYLNIGKCYYFSHLQKNDDEKIHKAFSIFSGLVKENKDYPYGYLWLARVQKVYFSNEPKILIKSNYAKFLATVNTSIANPKNLQEAHNYIDALNK